MSDSGQKVSPNSARGNSNESRYGKKCQWQKMAKLKFTEFGWL